MWIASVANRLPDPDIGLRLPKCLQNFQQGRLV